MLRELWLLSVIGVISGCDAFSSTSVAEICEKHPQMCRDLNPDAWCRTEKSHIIRSRYNNLQAPSDNARHQLLLNFEAFKECIERAAQIEHVKLREKNSGRVAGLITAESELQRLARNTRDSDDPKLLCYHWSRFGSQLHLQKFLDYQGTTRLETPELQLALATYYSKKDSELTKGILLHALELTKKGGSVNPEILKGLTNIFLKDEQYQDAYIWGYVASEFEVNNINLPELEALLVQHGMASSTVKKQARRYYQAIVDGEFKSPLPRKL